MYVLLKQRMLEDFFYLFEEHNVTIQIMLQKYQTLEEQQKEKVPRQIPEQPVYHQSEIVLCILKRGIIITLKMNLLVLKERIFYKSALLLFTIFDIRTQTVILDQDNKVEFNYCTRTDNGLEKISVPEILLQ